MRRAPGPRSRGVFLPLYKRKDGEFFSVLCAIKLFLRGSLFSCGSLFSYGSCFSYRSFSGSCCRCCCGCCCGCCLLCCKSLCNCCCNHSCLLCCAVFIFLCTLCCKSCLFFSALCCESSLFLCLFSCELFSLFSCLLTSHEILADTVGGLHILMDSNENTETENNVTNGGPKNEPWAKWS